jgi:hypothetical protein
MPRSTRDRVDQKLVNQQQTKEEVAKPRKTKTRSLAKDYRRIHLLLHLLITPVVMKPRLPVKKKSLWHFMMDFRNS